MSDTPNPQNTPPPAKPNSEESKKSKIDVKLLDQQLADMDSDEFDSDDDSHTGGCSCCPGKVGEIRKD